MNTPKLALVSKCQGKMFYNVDSRIENYPLTATYACTDNTVTWTTGASPANRLGFQDDTEFRLLKALVYYGPCHSKPASFH
jgi:hypothetical protein